MHLLCCISKNYFLLSDLQGVKTFAKKDGSDWILNGSKVRDNILLILVNVLCSHLRLLLRIMGLAFYSFSAKQCQVITFSILDEDSCCQSNNVTATDNSKTQST